MPGFQLSVTAKTENNPRRTGVREADAWCEFQVSGR